MASDTKKEAWAYAIQNPDGTLGVKRHSKADAEKLLNAGGKSSLASRGYSIVPMTDTPAPPAEPSDGALIEAARVHAHGLTAKGQHLEAIEYMRVACLSALQPQGPTTADDAAVLDAYDIAMARGDDDWAEKRAAVRARMGVPEGYALVPRVLTEPMLRAVRFALENWRGQDLEKTADPKLKHQIRWDAALAAAPAPEVK